MKKLENSEIAFIRSLENSLVNQIRTLSIIHLKKIQQFRVVVVVVISHSAKILRIEPVVDMNLCHCNFGSFASQL